MKPTICYRIIMLYEKLYNMQKYKYYGLIILELAPSG